MNVFYTVMDKIVTRVLVFILGLMFAFTGLIIPETAMKAMYKALHKEFGK